MGQLMNRILKRENKIKFNFDDIKQERNDKYASIFKIRRSN